MVVEEIPPGPDEAARKLELVKVRGSPANGEQSREPGAARHPVSILQLSAL